MRAARSAVSLPFPYSSFPVHYIYNTQPGQTRNTEAPHSTLKRQKLTFPSRKVVSTGYSDAKKRKERMGPLKRHSFPSPLAPFLFLTALLSVVAASRARLPANVTVPAIFIFGDSIMDTGNNNNLATVVKANFQPYGVDFTGGPTGRFCDGKVPSDIIAEELGIKGSVPAYLDPSLQPKDLLTGVSFASAGAGFDPITAKLVSVLSLSQQLRYFKEYTAKVKSMVGEKRTHFILGNAVYLVVAGSDDIANTYFLLRARSNYDIPSYTSLMSDSASNFVQDCADDRNQAAILFNSKLKSKLNSLGQTLSNSRVVFIDVYTPLLQIIQTPKKYGFEISEKGCCGTGVLEVSILCNKLTPPCSNINAHVFWDSYHPTEKTYRVLVTTLLAKYSRYLVG
ncbi:unnamed protein product [Linum tenue]|uniref:GDSL esterase/lipase EXL3 n=1 Tax=Linum tenue TaxID=586396 RepID=A0AAV0HDE5_9ROSI|nr:unnamed protein product [Linum tenue]